MSLHQLGAPGCLVAHGFNSTGWLKVRRDRNKRIKALLQQQVQQRMQQEQQLLQQQQKQQHEKNNQGEATRNDTPRSCSRIDKSSPQPEQQGQQHGIKSSSNSSNSSSSSEGACLRIQEEGPVQAWEVIDECCFVLQQMFQLSAQPQPLKAFVTRWDEDPLFRCAYGYPSKVCCCSCCCFC